MKIIGGAGCSHTVENLAARDADQRILQEARKRRTRAEKAKFTDARHEWALFHGDTFSGQLKVMTGREAFVLNRRMEDVFWKALDKDPKARLSRWKVGARFVDGGPA